MEPTVSCLELVKHLDAAEALPVVSQGLTLHLEVLQASQEQIAPSSAASQCVLASNMGLKHTAGPLEGAF